jgi:hypothetical protein
MPPAPVEVFWVRSSKTGAAARAARSPAANKRVNEPTGVPAIYPFIHFKSSSMAGRREQFRRGKRIAIQFISHIHPGWPAEIGTPAGQPGSIRMSHSSITTPRARSRDQEIKR